MVVVLVVVVVYGGRESDWGEDVRSWKKVYGEERAEFLGWWRGEPWRGDLEMVPHTGVWRRLLRGLWADSVARRGSCSFVFVFVFRHVKRRIDVTAEAN